MHGAAWSIAAGVLAYPLLYGTAFELLHRAGVPTGLVLGACHAIVVFAYVRQRDTGRAAARAAIAHITYAVVLAFLYVTP
jgi:hypothetical protein